VARAGARILDGANDLSRAARAERALAGGASVGRQAELAGAELNIARNAQQHMAQSAARFEIGNTAAAQRVEGVYANAGGVAGSAADTGLTLIGKNRVMFQGLEVRAVRDLSHLGNSTLTAMAEKGFAGRLPNGESIILHHNKQNPAGFIIELPASKHIVWNVNQHPLGNSPGAGLTAQQRLEFNVWRDNYWRARARAELDRRAANQ
jgi:hypothetical protein